MNRKHATSRWRENPASFEAAGAILGVVAIFAGVFTAFGIVLSDDKPKKSASESAWKTIAPKLSNAELTSLKASDKYAARIEAFFAERKAGARLFAEDAFSLRGKLAFVQSKVPWANGYEHSLYLRARFEEHIFSADELKELIECAVREYLCEINGIEDKLLVEIRADLKDRDIVAASLAPALVSDENFKSAYSRIAQQISPALRLDTSILVARQVPGFFAAEIGSTVYVRVVGIVGARLGFSGGILGTGAAFSAETFGIAMLAGYLFDKILDWAMLKAGYDPEGELAAKVCEFLDETQTLLLDGDSQGGALGLRGELLKLHRERFKLCGESVKKMVFEGEHQ